MADSKRYYVSFDYSGPHDEYNTECIYSFDANGGIIIHDMHQYKHTIDLEACPGPVCVGVRRNASP